MKYVDEFRDAALARGIARAIASEVRPDRTYRFMEFCGGHTHAIARYGVPDLLPPNVQMIHGPGCPVCVLPVGRIDMAIRLALEHGAIVCTYADTLRVPASGGLTLLRAKAQGGDIRTVYAVDDALRVARECPEREVVFFAIGFETTTPPTAVAILQADAEGLANFSVLCCHVLTPAAIAAIVDAPADEAPEGVALDGFVGPAHVSTVIGSDPYARFASAHRKPVVIAGFEPLDVMQAILLLVRQVNDGRAEVENEFTRAVVPQGNLKAQQLMDRVFELRESFEWRGLGEVPDSALRLNERHARFDAERRFPLAYASVADNRACECGAILRGLKRPQECKLFGTVCTPETPMGSCMVSSEGACAAHYTYGRHKDPAPANAAVRGAEVIP
jgi:hydrogenase expression/formation protein HypD